MEMFSDFPKWYQSVDLERNTNRLLERWAGIVDLWKAIDIDLLDLFVDLATNRSPAGDPETYERFVGAFKKHDAYFDTEDAANEHALLAAAVLAVALAESSGTRQRFAIYAALSVTAALHGGGVTSVEAIDLDARARHALERLGEAVRNREGNLALKPQKKISLNFQKVLEDVPAFTDPDVTQRATTAMANAIAEAINASAKRMRDDLTAFKSHIDAKDEELEMLWWAFNGESTVLGKPFSKLKAGERALIGATELADRTLIVPGPISAKALLARTSGITGTKTTVEAVVDACNAGWLANNERKKANHRTPIHLGIAKRTEAGRRSVWADHWRATVGIKKTFQLPENEIAYLFYIECLLINQMEPAG